MYYILHDVVVKDLRSHLLKGNRRADNGLFGDRFGVPKTRSCLTLF